MCDVVLGSSAVIALLANEPGADTVRETLPGALLSAVNLAEIVAKLSERGMPPAEAASLVDAIGIEVIEFDAPQAVQSGALRPSTRSAGLSLGDRACLALADARGLTALTADTAWSQLDKANIKQIR